MSDPLNPVVTIGAPPNPTLSSSDISCPGQAQLTDPFGVGVIPGAGGTMKPGEYTKPVKITTAMTFGDCSAIPGEAAYPGIYRFDQGLWIGGEGVGEIRTGRRRCFGDQHRSRRRWGRGSPTAGLVLYQDPGNAANFGFDAQTADAAVINLTGVVYNGSLANYGAGQTMRIWDSSGGIPAYPGGTLQTGFGAGWNPGPAQSTAAGSVTITGTTVVDDFNTDGATTITIIGKPYKLPGGGILSLLG